MGNPYDRKNCIHKATETLASALPKEMARVREVLGHFREIGPAGMIGAAGTVWRWPGVAG